MRHVTQERFEVPIALSVADDEPVIVHQRPNATRNRTLALLIHGLGGSRYTYWGRLPEFLFEDFPDVDIGLYQYRTGLKRGFFDQHFELEDEAEVLADRLLDLGRARAPAAQPGGTQNAAATRAGYSSVVLIGHSMGGLLAKGAISHLVERNERKTLRRIAGLVLLASPQLGSLRVPWFFKIFSPDARALYPHNRYLRRTDEVIRSRVNLSAAARPDRALNIPTWAVVASGDFWVDATSARLNVPAKQSRVVRGDHGSIVRPPHRDADSYRLITDCIQAANKPRPHNDTLVCEDAENRDVQSIRRLAVEFFGEVVTSEAMIAALIASGRAIVKVVRRVTDVGDRRSEQMIGYFSLLPLTPDSADAIRSRALTGGALGPQHLLDPAAGVGAVYVGGVAARNYFSGAFVREALKTEVYRLSTRGLTELIAHPVTEDGLRLVLEHGFTPLREGGIDDIYVRRRQATPPGVAPAGDVAV